MRFATSRWRVAEREAAQGAFQPGAVSVGGALPATNDVLLHQRTPRDHRR